MPPLVIPSTIRAGIVWALSGSEFAVNVLHYRVGPATVLSATDATEWGADVSAAFAATSAWQDYVSQDVTLARVTLRDLRVANQGEFSATVGTAGSSASELLPPQCACCVTLRTALAGRSYRGRVYLPGATAQANSAAGTIESGAATAAELFIEDLITVIVDGQEWSLAVASPTLELSTPVTSVEVRDAVWDTQRRRSYPGI